MRRNKGNGRAIRWLCENADHKGKDCLIWPFSRLRGYGQFKHEGEKYYAHRYMCELAHGPAPTPEHQAAHSCGQGDRGCVNPNHLSWKTQSGNQLDRRLHGTKNRSWGRTGRLTPQQIDDIFALRGQKTHDEIASIFGVSRRNVGTILSGKSRRGPKERERILIALSAAKRPLTTAEIEQAAKMPGSASSILNRMLQAGEVVRASWGKYQASDDSFR